MISKRKLVLELNRILSENSIINYRGVEIRRFVMWRKNIDFNQNKYSILDIIIENTDVQKEITNHDIKSNNFEILECSKDDTFKIQPFDYCLDLYNSYK